MKRIKKICKSAIAMLFSFAMIFGFLPVIFTSSASALPVGMGI